MATIITRVNATIDNHNLAASLIALGLLASVSTISAAAINYNGQLAKNSYDTLVQPLPVVKTPTAATQAARTQATPQATTSILTLGTVKPLTLTLGTVTPQTLSLGTTKPQALTLGNANPQTLQNQPNTASQLQPAVGVSNVQASATTLQPSVNNAQQTGANPQNATNL